MKYEPFEDIKDKKRWRVKYQKLPDTRVWQMTAVADTEDCARRLSLFGIAMANRENLDVEEIVIVSCNEITT